MPGECGVKTGLSRGLPVQINVLDLFAEHCVVEYAALCSGAGMVSDEYRTVVSLVQTLDHAQRFVKALNRTGARVELLKQQVAHDPVRVVDENLIGSAVVGAEDGGVRVTCHEHSSA